MLPYDVLAIGKWVFIIQPIGLNLTFPVTSYTSIIIHWTCAIANSILSLLISSIPNETGTQILHRSSKGVISRLMPILLMSTTRAKWWTPLLDVRFFFFILLPCWKDGIARFAKFKTRKWVIIRWYELLYLLLFFSPSRGRKVTAFGVLFNFKGNDKNTTVQNVEDMVKESWVCHCFIYSRLFVIGTLRTVFGCYQRGAWFLFTRWVSISEYGKQKTSWLFQKAYASFPWQLWVSYWSPREEGNFDITPLLRAVCFQRHSCRPSQYAHPHIWRPHSHSWLPQVFFRNMTRF